MSIVQGTLPVGSLDHAITLNVQSSGGSHFETVTNTTPYLHRASPQDAASSMKLKKVVGGTIAWNQFNPYPKFENGKTGYSGVGGTFTVADGVAQVVIDTALQHAYDCRIQRGLTNTIKDHKYFFSAEATLSVNGKVNVYMAQMSGTAAKADVIANQFVELNVIYNRTIQNGAISVSTGDDFAQRQIGDILYVRKMCVYDLTQMFGSTIADYIYSLEQAHAGDGVAWFKALFPKSYYAYNSGELMSVKTSAHKTVGFNQWDEEWEVGALNVANGNTLNVITYLRSKNYIPVVTGATYYRGIGYLSDFRLFYYDADKHYITSEAKSSVGTFTIPNGVSYIKFHKNGATYGNNICINLSSSRNGEYEPYEEHTYPLDGNLTLRGIPKLDSNNELYYDGDTYASDGTVTRKYGIRAYTEGDTTDGSTMITDGTNTVYKLITPTTESADAYTQSQRVGATEEFVDGRTVEIPVGNVSEYKRLIQED